MGLADIIKKSCKELHITYAELAKRSNQSPQNLGKKLKKDTLSFDEFLTLLKTLGIRFDYHLTMPNAKGAGFESDVFANDKYRQKISDLEHEKIVLKKNIDYLFDAQRDSRVYLNTISGAVDHALKHIKEEEKVKVDLEKIRFANRKVATLLNETNRMRDVPINAVSNEVEDEVIKKIQGKRILVVDDNVLNREMLKELLEDYDAKVELAIDGREAVHKVKNNILEHYDAILMDLYMPKMDGVMATESIREENTIVPIIGISSNTASKDLAKVEKCGMNAFLRRPIEVKELLSVLSSVMNA